MSRPPPSGMLLFLEGQPSRWRSGRGGPTKRVDLAWCEWTGCLAKDRGPHPGFVKWPGTISPWLVEAGWGLGSRRERPHRPLPDGGSGFGQILRPGVLLNRKEMARRQDTEPMALLHVTKTTELPHRTPPPWPPCARGKKTKKGP